VNDQVRRTLSELIIKHGRSLCNEPRRCKGLLQDGLGNHHKREFHALIGALEEQGPADLLSGLNSQPWAVVATRLVRRLVENRPMTEDMAWWTVESWALALGVITEAALKPRPTEAVTTRVRQIQERPTGERREDQRAADLITSRAGRISLKLIPTGEFWMGSTESDQEAFEDEQPRHKVEISEAFYLGVTPVTQAQYEAVRGKSPSHFQGRPNNPVECVSWFEAVLFCNELSRMEVLAPFYVARRSKPVIVAGGEGYRLPTEAEWEYACRAGAETRFSFGDDEERLRDYACYSANSGRQTWPVGQKRPNAWGLCDMHGNVWEWCWDGYDEDYYRRSPDVDPPGAEDAACRVTRGGSWNDLPRDVRAASRVGLAPDVRHNYLGFRVARGRSGC
jgi:formylglycine-generating enzyme required for sulfatase activity